MAIREVTELSCCPQASLSPSNKSGVCGDAGDRFCSNVTFSSPSVGGPSSPPSLERRRNWWQVEMSPFEERAMGHSLMGPFSFLPDAVSAPASAGKG